MDGVESALVDTTARAVLRMKKDKEPTVKAINTALGRRMSTKKVTKTEMAKAAEVYTVQVKGLG